MKVIWLEYVNVNFACSSSSVGQAGVKLRSRVLGLCGDLNEEALFELRGPQRCVLSDSRLMAAAYETSGRAACRPTGELQARLLRETTAAGCAKHEGSHTPHITWLIPSSHNSYRTTTRQGRRPRPSFVFVARYRSVTNSCDRHASLSTEWIQTRS